jgi:hypothetical protein
MINERKALFRQAQAMFHEHLLGVYRWDDALIVKPREAPRIPGRDREAGKFKDQLTMILGPFDIEIEGPDERPPLGNVRVNFGNAFLDGPLDATTWAKVADFIKKHKSEELSNVETGQYATARDSWGR